MATIFWFRQDLRISDNPGLHSATGAVLPIYILDPKVRLGGASKWWLHHSLIRLNKSLAGNLNLYVGEPEVILQEIIEKNNITSVHWTRCYEPLRVQQDNKIQALIEPLECKSFNGSLLWEPWEVLKDDATPYKVFAPFYKKAQLKVPRFPQGSPVLDYTRDALNKTKLEDLHLLAAPPWHKKMEKYWCIGEDGAHSRLENFLEYGLVDYKHQRNLPDKTNVSRLSPHLHFGEISSNQVWFAVRKMASRVPQEDIECFLSELGWREFSYHLLYHFPSLASQNFQSKFDVFPWNTDLSLLSAWHTGQTGYPIVDAGMRELWETGYMHNRVRMIVGSFLVKNLLLHWKYGERWFWDCLVDADLANNSASWQWVAGSGANPAPYFRVFHPTAQAQKFDPDGNYIRKYVPELRFLPNQYLFKPWDAPEEVLKAAGVALGQSYPKPIVDFENSRQLALNAFYSMKGQSKK